MQSAPLTKDEQERLKALYAYDVLDTDAEKVFDDLTRLASEICETPIALISLVDPNRQWFKSKVGIDAAETSRDIAFCAHAIHQREIFEVTDTLEDKRFFDNPLVTSDPNIRFYAGTPLVTPGGQAIGTLCAISDKPKKLNDHQRQALDILGREVISQLELRLKIKQLDEANQNKTDYLSNLSHELRTPLNAIISLTHLMMNESDNNQLPDNYVEYLSHIDFSGKRLLSLVNSVLDLSKVEEGKLELMPVSIDTLKFCQAVEGMMRAKAAEKGVEFKVIVSKALPNSLFYDEEKLSQIILNLLSNAIKFASDGENVELEVSCDTDHLFIEVRDTGCGISEADLPLLFDKFKQVGERKGEEGSGLGLSITKALVELMSGEISFTSRLQIGTTATVKLPLESSSHQENKQETQMLTFDTNAKILVVEDNFINQEVVKAVFDALDMTIEIAETGEQALEMIEHKTYDLIFMDLHLPGIDGWETTKRIRNNGIKTPIVALSADAFNSTKSQMRERGMNGYMTKPIDNQYLVKVLANFIPKP